MLNFIIAIAFFITEGGILLIQAALAFSNLIFIFGIDCQGSIVLAISIAILMGFSGVSLGETPFIISESDNFLYISLSHNLRIF
jgi:hypothetical protein